MSLSTLLWRARQNALALSSACISVGLSVGWLGCGSDSSSGTGSEVDGGLPNDAGTSSDAPATTDASGEDVVASHFDAGMATGLVVIRLDNSLCDPAWLPDAGNGTTACRILLVTSSCSAPGLTAADQTTIDAVNAKLKSSGQPPLSKALCVLTQFPAANTPAGACTDQSAPGWCYVHSACASGGTTPCDQALCTTPALTTAFDGAWLECP